MTWVPENLNELEKYARKLEATTASTEWKAIDLTVIGFHFARAVMEMRAARDQGFDPTTTLALPSPEDG